MEQLEGGARGDDRLDAAGARAALVGRREEHGAHALAAAQDELPYGVHDRDDVLAAGPRVGHARVEPACETSVDAGPDPSDELLESRALAHVLSPRVAGGLTYHGRQGAHRASAD